jgi:poly-gamma-glutamate capsule biosynthesis protein CapA/YwtB (metallophosphatase superfamily)
LTGSAIGLLGDAMLGRQVADALARMDPEEVWSPSLRALVEAECAGVVCNLECCLSTRGERTRRIPGKPFYFRAPPAAVKSLRALGVRAAGVANNHALDYEVDALDDTLELLGGAGIATTGAGPDVEAARRAAIVELEGPGRIALVAVSDHPSQFAAGPDTPGIAWADLRAGLPEWLAGALARAKQEADLVIAFPHWGPNMSQAPARWQRRRAADLLKAGADLVAGHSAHVFHGVGRGRDGQPILFDLGGAVDDYAIDPQLRNDIGLLALWRSAGDPDLEVVALHLQHARTDIAGGPEAEWAATRLARACRRLGTTAERTGEARFTVT